MDEASQMWQRPVRPAGAPPVPGTPVQSLAGATHRRLVQWLTVPSTALRAGDRVGPYELSLSPELVRQFAEATLDDDQQLRHGR